MDDGADSGGAAPPGDQAGLQEVIAIFVDGLARHAVDDGMRG